MRYFTQGWAESDVPRRDMLLDIATEELSHLEMIGQIVVGLLKGAKTSLIDEVEGGYLGDFLEGSKNSTSSLAWMGIVRDLGRGWSAPPDHAAFPGRRRTSTRIRKTHWPICALDIAAEARAKIVYEVLINCVRTLERATC